MKAKLLLWVVMLALLASMVSALLTDGVITYHKFDDNDLNGEEGLYNWTNYVTTNSTGKIGSSRYYNGSAYMTLDGGNNLLKASGTINLWANLSSGNSKWMFGRWNNPPNEFTLQVDAAGKVAAMDTGLQSTAAMATGTWVMVTITWGGGNSSVWINGVYNASAAKSLTPASVTTYLGANEDAGPGNFWLGWIDELGVWNRSLTQTEITTLYNDGNGLTYPFTTTTDIDFTAVDDFNASSITSFSVNISWPNTTVQTESTTNGTVSLSNVSDTNLNVNVTYFGITDYYNLTLFDVSITANESNTVQASMYQAQVNMAAREKISNASVSGSVFYTGSKSGTVFNLTAATHTIKFTHEGYYNLSSDFVISALTNTTQTITGVYGGVANITVYYPNSTVLPSWGVNITSVDYANWTGEHIDTTNGSVYFNGINGTYTALINSSLGNESFTFTIDDSTEAVPYYYFSIDNCSNNTQIMLNFTIYQENTSNLLNNSAFDIWLNISGPYLIGDRQYNFSFSVANYYTLCVPANTISNWTTYAQMTYSNLPTYAEKNYYLFNYTLAANSTGIPLYLTGGTTQVKLQVRDYNDDPIADAYVKVMSYDVGLNSYTVTEIVKTDTAGDAFAQIVQNTDWYAFIVEYNGVIVLQTLPTKITTSSLTLRVNLETDYFASYDVTQGITSDLTFDNDTATFSFTFSDPTGGVTQGCLVLTRISINGETLLNTSCSVSSAATILMVIPETVGTNSYKADGYATISGQNFLLETLTYAYNTTFKTFGLSGIFLSMLLILVLVFVGLWHPVASVVLMVVGVVATNVMGIFYLNWTYIVTFIILAVITIYRTGRSE